MNRTLAALVLLSSGLGCAKGIPLPDATATVTIPAGNYLVGGKTDACNSSQNKPCGSSEPTHPIVLSRPFEMEVHEVTVKQYAACAAVGKCCDQDVGDYIKEGDLPAQVSIDQARQYCRYRDRRLPTEAEWEVAARLKDIQGNMQVFPWGDSPRACGEVPSQDCSSGNTSLNPVASNSIDRTPLGIYDMAGSLPEWVEDDFVVSAGCRYATPVSVLCANDSACMTSQCAGGSACQNECFGNNNSLGECGVDTSSPTTCLSTPDAEAAVDPFHVTYDHSTQNQDTGCGSKYPSNSWGDNAPNPLRKGGGAFDNQCWQNPAARDGSSVNIGFRCATGAAPKAALTVRLQLGGSAQLRCGVLSVSLAGNTQPPGWGSRIQVALTSHYGVAPAKFDVANSRYDIDLTDTRVLPATPCTSSSQFPVSGGTGLLLTNMPLGTFSVQIQYPAAYNGNLCDISYTQKLELSNGESHCPTNFNGANTSNPQCL